MAGKKRRRNVPLYVWVSPEELQAIKARMEQTGIRNMSAYIRKMALNGYVLQVDLSPVRELVSLQRRCANNLNQAALHVNTYGGLYPNELQALQKDYADLWGPLSELLEKLACEPWERPRPLPGCPCPLDTVSRGGENRIMIRAKWKLYCFCEKSINDLEKPKALAKESKQGWMISLNACPSFQITSTA